MLQMFKKYYLGSIGSVVVGLIFYAWFNYPSWIKSKDEPLLVKQDVVSQQVPKLTFDALFKQEPTFIPYKLSSTQELSADIEPSRTKFQAIGEKYGTFGDTYGALNTLFSGLAFAVLIITMLMQRQELKEQRKELAQQRNELIAQRKEAEQGNKIAKGQREITKQQGDLIKQQIDEAKVQNFYFILFKHLESLDNQLSRTQLNISGTTGENALKEIALFFITFIEENAFDEGALVFNKKDMLQGFVELHTNLIFIKNIDLSQNLYFKNIFLILRFIEENEKSINNRQPIQILISSISNDGMICLVWLAIISKNTELKKIIEKYGLLQKLESVFNYELIIFFSHFLDKKAFREI